VDFFGSCSQGVGLAITHCEPIYFWSDSSLFLSSYLFFFSWEKRKQIVEGQQPWLVGCRELLVYSSHEIILECMDALA
jgi:hypothetical protein